MKKVLIVAGTYYPDSMATIGITHRFAEALVKKGYDVSVFTARDYDYSKRQYPKELNGVNIIDCDDVNKPNNFCFRLRTFLNKFSYKVFKKLKNKGKLREVFYKNPRNRLNEYDLSYRIKTLVDEFGFDTVLTVALPYRIHRIGHRVKKLCPDIKWVTISFDPYAFDEVTNIDRKQQCIREEERIYKTADKVMLLSQFKNDYADSKFKHLITYFDLPNVRKLELDEDAGKIDYDKSKINCVFLGNFFLIQRHPKFLFELFERINNDKVVLYIVGSLFDIKQEYIDAWKEKLGDKLIIYGRVPQQKAINSMFGADVLINVGHTTTNQCPSKVLDYISTGKPILSVTKVDRCTSLPVLEKYPNALTIFEQQGISDEMVNKVEKFIADSKLSEVYPLEKSREIFSDFTMETMISKFED